MTAAPESAPPKQVNPVPEDLGYLNLPRPSSDLLQWPEPEGIKEKMIRKTKENPFVPFGLAVTVFALSYGIWQMKTGDRVMSQKMMRLRVGAQGFTVLALLGGVAYSAHKSKVARLQKEQQKNG